MAKDDRNLILALVADLYFGVQIEKVASELGYAVEWIERAAQVGPQESDFMHLLAAWEPALVIVDLNNKALPWEGWIRLAKGNAGGRQVPVLAFGSHKDVDSMQRAKEAGADMVVAKSRFTADLPALVGKLVG